MRRYSQSGHGRSCSDSSLRPLPGPSNCERWSFGPAPFQSLEANEAADWTSPPFNVMSPPDKQRART